jgi:MoaD family protein
LHDGDFDKERVIMSIQVRIPTTLRRFTGGVERVDGSGTTVRAVLKDIELHHPGIEERICEDGRVRHFVTVFVNGEDMRFLDNLDTPLKDGDEISIVPAIAGG